MPKPIGQMLVEGGVIKLDDLNVALGRLRSHGGRLASCCLFLGFGSERALSTMLSRQLGVPFLVLSQSAVPLAALDLLPLAVATKLRALPLRRDGKTLFVALANPKDIGALDELRFGTGCRVMAYGALAGPLQGAIEDAYRVHQNKISPHLVGLELDPNFAPGLEGHLELVRGDAATSTMQLPQLSSLPTLAEAALPTTTGTMAAVRPPVVPQGPASVLVVDDEHDIRSILVEFLTRTGYSVRAAADGHEALAMLQLELPDAMVLDAMLPGVHGFDICQRVKGAASTAQVRIIMISAIYRGWRYAGDVRRMYGADAFLEKPFRLEELRRTLEAALKGQPKPSGAEELTLHAQGMLTRAATSYREGKGDEAVQMLEEAAAAAPFAAVLQQHLGTLYDQLNQPYRAIAAYEKLVELQPNYPNLLALARMYQKTGFTHKAVEAWERCLWSCDKKDEAEQIRKHLSLLLDASRTV